MPKEWNPLKYHKEIDAIKKLRDEKVALVVEELKKSGYHYEDLKTILADFIEVGPRVFTEHELTRDGLVFVNFNTYKGTATRHSPRRWCVVKYHTLPIHEDADIAQATPRRLRKIFEFVGPHPDTGEDVTYTGWEANGSYMYQYLSLDNQVLYITNPVRAASTVRRQAERISAELNRSPDFVERLKREREEYLKLAKK